MTPPPSAAERAARRGSRVDDDALAVYAAEDRATEQFPLRRFNRFTHIEAFVAALTTSPWWDQRFGAAPIEVVVIRRSHSATVSCATVADGHVGVIALVDGHGWGLETVLHELAHVAVRIRAGHGPAFRAALADLWRHEAGVVAWSSLDAALRPGRGAELSRGADPSCVRPGGGRHVVSPPPAPLP